MPVRAPIFLCSDQKANLCGSCFPRSCSAVCRLPWSSSLGVSDARRSVHFRIHSRAVHCPFMRRILLALFALFLFPVQALAADAVGVWGGAGGGEDWWIHAAAGSNVAAGVSQSNANMATYAKFTSATAAAAAVCAIGHPTWMCNNCTANPTGLGDSAQTYCGNATGVSTFIGGVGHYYKCKTGGLGYHDKFYSAKPNDALCTVVPQCDHTAGQDVTSSGFVDLGTNPDKPNYLSCEGGCMAIFTGDFPVKVGLTGGVAHYYGSGNFEYMGSGAAQACTSTDQPDPVPSTPPNTCPTGQVAVNTTLASGGAGTPICVNTTNGNENDPNDKNNDGKPDSCQPGSYSTADGWDVTVTWNASTSTCTQHGVKSGKPDIDYSGPPGQPMPFQDPHPPVPGPGNDGPGTVPANDPVADFCKKNADSPLCKKSTTGGSCATFTCTGDAAVCATAKAAERLACNFDNTKTLANVMTDASLTATKASFLASVDSGVPTDISTLLHTNTRDLSGTCPAPIPVVTPWKTVSVGFGPLCDIAGIIGVMMMLAATFVSVRLLAGGAG